MEGPLPTSTPDPHRRFLARANDVLAADARLVGVAAAGSFASDAMDEFSDLDLVIATEVDAHASVMADRRRIAAALGPLLAAFTGEHVGEPRLLICLYDDVAPLHVDLKFVALPDAARRVDEPVVLWERDGRLTRALGTGRAAYPAPDAQWIEDRFWVWVHYIAAKIGRGEIFEALDGLAHLRAWVLGPLALAGAGGAPSGVRRLEALVPAHAPALRATVASYGAADCARALRASIDSYRALRTHHPPDDLRGAAEEAAVRYLGGIEEKAAMNRPMAPVGDGWRVGHEGRDAMYYEEWDGAEWRRLALDGEMCGGGQPHHVIDFGSKADWDGGPAWARQRRDEIIARIKSAFPPPGYEYAGESVLDQADEQRLIAAAGGLSSEECGWAGCHERALKAKNVCVRHTHRGSW
jgi:hypothetical protein